jgi:uncharacterized membrane protein
MTERLFWTMQLVTALGSGLIAGVFFAFSVFIMNALARLPAAQGMAAMQSINITVINPLMMTALFGTGLLCLVLGGKAVWQWQQAGSAYLLAASLLYLIGVVLVTMLGNVPLNDALAQTEPSSVEAAQLWTRYLTDWTKWNHIRTLAGFVAAALFIIGLRF